MNSEELTFKVSLSGTYHSKVPEYSILLDDQVIQKAAISKSSEEIEDIEFKATLTDGPHSLKIRLENKESSDTLKDNYDSEDYQIIGDMLLNIDNIQIDDIALGQLLWDSEYILDEPQLSNGELTTSIEHCVNLGWNGTYVLNFSSPFYIWLLEKL